MSRAFRSDLYLMVATALKQAMDSTEVKAERDAVAWVAKALADAFAEHSSSFDPVRFLQNAGVQ